MRRRFEHLHVELSVAAGTLIPRYALWLYLHDRGWDPEQLSREAVIAFTGEHLQAFLADRGLRLSSREERRLVRTLRRYDPRQPTPYEVMQRIFSDGSP